MVGIVTTTNTTGQVTWRFW